MVGYQPNNNDNNISECYRNCTVWTFRCFFLSIFPVASVQTIGKQQLQFDENCKEEGGSSILLPTNLVAKNFVSFL